MRPAAGRRISEWATYVCYGKTQDLRNMEPPEPTLPLEGDALNELRLELHNCKATVLGRFLQANQIWDTAPQLN